MKSLRSASFTIISTGLFTIAGVQTSCSGSGSTDTVDQARMDSVMAYVPQYVEWLTEDGIADVELECRACEVMWRVSQLRERGDSAIADAFVAELRNRMATAGNR